MCTCKFHDICSHIFLFLDLNGHEHGIGIGGVAGAAGALFIVFVAVMSLSIYILVQRSKRKCMLLIQITVKCLLAPTCV